jgi:hypothetical protein
VPLWAYGPINNTPSGHYDNTDLAKIIAEALHFRLPDIQNKLYVKVSDVFKASEWEVDLADQQNPMLEISYHGKKADLPTSKDLLTLSWNDYSKTYLLSSIVVYCPDIKDVYIPREAVNMITSYPQPLTLFGNVAIGTVYDQNDANAQSISYFKCTASGLVTDIRAYISGTSAGNCIAAIYAVNGDSAGALLAQSNPVSIGTSSSWVDFKLPTPYTVTAGTTYGLAVMGDVPVNLMVVAGTGQRDHNALSSYANGFVNPFGPIWGTHDIGAMSIYASGTSNT